MRKLFVSAILAGLIIGGGGVFAADMGASGQTNTGTSGNVHMKSSTSTMQKSTTQETIYGSNMIRGEITSITGNTVTLRDRLGDTHTVTVTDPSTLSGLNVGDNVEVRFQSASISKISGTPEENAPNMGPNEGSQPLSNPPSPETQESGQGTR